MLGIRDFPHYWAKELCDRGSVIGRSFYDFLAPKKKMEEKL